MKRPTGTAHRDRVRNRAKGEVSKVQAPIPQIDGIDVAAGLKRVAGNVRLYRSLLDQFVANNPMLTCRSAPPSRRVIAKRLRDWDTR